MRKVYGSIADLQGREGPPERFSKELTGQTEREGAEGLLAPGGKGGTEGLQGGWLPRYTEHILSPSASVARGAQRDPCKGRGMQWGHCVEAVKLT